MTNKTLDSENHDLGGEAAMLSVKWWEKKRLLFNIILVLFTGFMALIKSELPNSWLNNWSLISALIWIFGANLVYCGSWGSELLWSHYLKRTPFWVEWRMFIFILGVLFSMMWTWIALIPYI